MRYYWVKGISLYPSKKGYTPDKFGLPWNLWALRVAGKNSPETHTLGKLLYLIGSSKTDISGFLGVGDSMIRYLQNHAFFRSAMAGIVSKGGAVVNEVTEKLQQCLERYRPGIIFIHTGVNNLSKTYLYQNEMHQIATTKSELAGLECVVSNYVSGARGVRIILSSITATKDGRINARAKDINEYIEQCCMRNGWCFMNNDNIGKADLRDTVHFDTIGENKFFVNLEKTIRHIMV